MNNFKKLLASAMALSMVASVMPANGVNAAFSDIRVEAPASARTYINRLVAALEAINKDVSTVTVGDVVTFEGSEETILTIESNSVVLNADLAGKLRSVQSFVDEDSEPYTISETLLNMPAALNNMINGHVSGNYVDAALALVAESGTAVDYEVKDEMLTVDEYEDAVTLMEKMIAVEAYEDNIPEDRTNGGSFYSKEEYMDLKSDLQDKIDEFEAENYGDLLDDYITALENEYNAFIQNYITNTNEAIDKDAIDDEIEAIQKGTVASEYITSANYRAFGTHEAVEEIMAQFEDLYDGAEAADEALDRNNEATEAYTSRGTYEFDGTTYRRTSVRTLINTKTYSDVLDGINSETFPILEDYYNDVVMAVYQLDERQYGSVYVDRSDKTLFVTQSQANNVLANITTSAAADEDAVVLTSMADNETGDRYFDALVERMDAVATAYETVTTGVRGITVNNLSSRNVAQVVDAYKALQLVAAGGDYRGNLTAEEVDAVDAAETNIRLLYARALLEGIATDVVTGWVDLGNGNWDYYDENGNAFTGWVCTATDTWYYVSNGHMLRNAWVWRDATSAYYVGNDGVMLYGPATTPDGYAIDANGLWHA